jgi:hypothetical protein
MPSRWLSLSIIAFWLAMSGLFFWRDLWPDLRPGEPPPYKADLVEEAQRRQGHGRPTTWTVYHNDVEAFMAETWVNHQVEDDTFEMESQLVPRPPFRPITPKWLPQVELRRGRGSYRVDRDGNLVGVVAEFNLRAKGGNLILKGLAGAKGFAGDVVLTLTGEVRDGKLYPHWHIDNSLGNVFDLQFEPIAVPHRGSVVMPLQPVNRLRGLRPGQTWRIPLLEPLAMVGLGGGGVKYLDARVLPAPEVLSWKGETIPCLVIEYHGEDVTGRTWVATGARGEDRVLRQEFDLADDVRWAIQRNQ